MPLTDFQRRVCRALADQRIKAGTSYVAGGVALNEILNAPRVSRDIDLFHDAGEAVLASWTIDRALLTGQGYDLSVIREFPAFVEAVVSRGPESVVLQWVHDSAFRFFPLIEHPDFGLMLHPLDLAINKTLALIGRAEVRDWIDIITCHKSVHPLGCLAWAAAGKDPSLNPRFVLDQASRTAHYTQAEYATLDFAVSPGRISDLASEWRSMLQDAGVMIDLLPEEHVGCCVMHRNGSPFRGNSEELKSMLEQKLLHFHPGALRGAWPKVVER